MEDNMIKQDSEFIQPEKPVMDDETYTFVQELFQLARLTRNARTRIVP